MCVRCSPGHPTPDAPGDLRRPRAFCAAGWVRASTPARGQPRHRPRTAVTLPASEKECGFIAEGAETRRKQGDVRGTAGGLRKACAFYSPGAANGHGAEANGRGATTNGHGAEAAGHGFSTAGHGAKANGHGASTNGRGAAAPGNESIANGHEADATRHGSSTAIRHAGRDRFSQPHAPLHRSAPPHPRRELLNRGSASVERPPHPPHARLGGAAGWCGGTVQDRPPVRSRSPRPFTPKDCLSVFFFALPS